MKNENRKPLKAKITENSFVFDQSNIVVGFISVNWSSVQFAMKIKNELISALSFTQKRWCCEDAAASVFGERKYEKTL